MLAATLERLEEMLARDAFEDAFAQSIAALLPQRPPLPRTRSAAASRIITRAITPTTPAVLRRAPSVQTRFAQRRYVTDLAGLPAGIIEEVSSRSGSSIGARIS